MKHFRFSFLAFLVVAASSLALADDKSDIKANYVKLKKALVSRDVDAMMAMATPDFKEKHGQQTFDGKAAANQMKQMFAMLKRIRNVDVNVKSIKITGKTAVAMTSM